MTAFLLLHELTAVVPLLALTTFFHSAHWLPPLISEGKWIADGVEKFGRWFRRRGWLGPQDDVALQAEKNASSRRARWWDQGEGGVRLVVE